MYMHKHYGVSIIHFRFFCMIDLHALPFNREGLVFGRKFGEHAGVIEFHNTDLLANFI